MCLPEQLLAAIKGVYTGFDVRIAQVTHEYKGSGIKLDGNFCYLTFRDAAPTVDEFAEYTYHRIIPYCLPRKTRAEKDKKYASTGDTRYIHELTDQARNLFIKARQTQGKSGEPGEVILFMFLEAILGAPQIACKMYLKTSEKMPVHGSDSVHLGVGKSGPQLLLFWGESKLYCAVSSALDEIAKSISTFISSKSGRAPRERDLDIIVDHMDIEDAGLKTALTRYFDPYEKDSLNLQEVYACFVGFDYCFRNTEKCLTNEEIEEQFKKAYSDRVSAICELFAEKMKKSGLHQLKFHVFLLPFPSIADFRKQFFGHLGCADAS